MPEENPTEQPVKPELFTKELVDKLFRNWPGRELSFRPGYSVKGEGSRVFLYIDKDAIMQRLDEVLGQTRWRASYRIDLDAYICKLELFLAGEWHWKEGIGAKPDMAKEQDSIKGAGTDAFRQAADAWGFGRYLGRLPEIIWPAQYKESRWQSWIDKKKLREHIDAINAGRTPKPPPPPQPGTTTTTTTKPDPPKPAAQGSGKPATVKPPPAPALTREKPAQGVADRSSKLLTGALRKDLLKVSLAAGVPLPELIKREFLCTIDELSIDGANWLYHGIKDAWLELESLKPSASDKVASAAKALTGAEAEGYSLAQLNNVTKEGEHYNVKGIDGKFFTVWKKDEVIQCDCMKRRTKPDDPICAHIHAVKYAPAKPGTNGTTNDKPNNTARKGNS